MNKRNVFFLLAFVLLGISLCAALSIRTLGLPVANGGEAPVDLAGAFVPDWTSYAADWIQVESPVQDWLLDVDMIDSENGWAVGANGAILRFEEGVWRGVNSPTTSNLSALAMYDRERGMAIGNQPVTFLQYRDGDWLEVADPVKGDDLYGPIALTDNPIRTGGIYDIDLFGEDQALAVGGRLGLNDWAALIRLDETEQWLSLVRHKQPFSLMGISLTRDGSGWGVGDGVILPFAKGAVVDRQPVPQNIEATLTAVATIDRDEAWAVGTNGILAHYENDQWQVLETSWSDVDFSDISMVNRDEGWAVGSRGTIIHYFGGNWQLSSQQHPLEALVRPLFLISISMTSADEGWIVGSNGAILRYQQES